MSLRGLWEVSKGGVLQELLCWLARIVAFGKQEWQALELVECANALRCASTFPTVLELKLKEKGGKHRDRG